MCKKVYKIFDKNIKSVYNIKVHITFIVNFIQMKRLILLSLAFTAFTAVGLSSNTYAGTGCVGTGATCFTTTAVQLDILPGDMCIGSTGAFDFGSFIVSAISQTVTGAFAGADGYFYVDDLKGDDLGYYTTIQLNADMDGPGSATLSSGNVYMKTPAIGSGGITTIAGSVNSNVEVHPSMTGYQSLDVARQLIIRDNTSNLGVIGQYGVLPELELVIPAYQAVGLYTATLTYTFYEN